MARPRATEPKTTICVKMTHQERDRLFAVALDVQRGTRGSDLTPSEVNLSEFLRQAVFKIVEAYEDQVGVALHPDAATRDDHVRFGAMTLLQHLRDAEHAEKEADAARARRAAEDARQRAELSKSNAPLGSMATLQVVGAGTPAPAQTKTSLR